MSVVNSQNPVSAALAQGADVINPFVAGVRGAGVSEEARLAFAPAPVGSLENAFQRQYSGLVVGRFLFGYYGPPDYDQAQPRFRVDLIDSPVGLGDLAVDITFRGISIGTNVISSNLNFPRNGVLRDAIMAGLIPNSFTVTQRLPGSSPKAKPVEIGSGTFGSSDENQPIAIAAASLVNLAVGAISRVGLPEVNRLAINSADNRI